MILFRKRKLKAAQAERRAALTLLADARARKDTRAMSDAHKRLRDATHEVMRLEGWGNG